MIKFTLLSSICDSQDTDCLTSRSDLSMQVWMLQRWCNALPSQTTKFQYLGTIATALSHFLLYLGCVHDGLRFRIFAKGKPSVSFHHPLFPASFGQNQPSCASYRRRTPFLRLLLLCPLPFKRRELSRHAREVVLVTSPLSRYP